MISSQTIICHSNYNATNLKSKIVMSAGLLHRPNKCNSNLSIQTETWKMETYVSWLSCVFLLTLHVKYICKYFECNKKWERLGVYACVWRRSNQNYALVVCVLLRFFFFLFCYEFCSCAVRCRRMLQLWNEFSCPYLKIRNE